MVGHATWSRARRVGRVMCKWSDVTRNDELWLSYAVQIVYLPLVTTAL